MYLVLGLGNPGGKYARTRHNAGFLVVDRWAERHGVSCDRRQLGALVEKIRVADQDVVLAKPQGFMNLSGQPAASLRGFYKVELPQIIVVHDELDLLFGEVRVKVGGGHGGHNGLRDLQAKLGGNQFLRVRVGVSRPPEGWDPADYVLSGFTASEQAQLDQVLDLAIEAVEQVVSNGPEAAMNRTNERPRRAAAS